ncbi:MAG: adenosylmethionine decarboxylase [Gammaproteobacteria bacterium]|nr:adenosylmethionine decarboxylase [Gammaproteobacteria bacterium]
MFFEGSEKKAEIIIDAGRLSLLTDFDDAFWAQMVEHCQAKILSSISNEHCKAFLLSESSLFVWQDHLVILTCGNTRLVNAVEYFLQAIDPSLVLQVIYQRKNEHFAYAQPTNFIDDVKLLKSHTPGKAYRFGEMYSHHNYLFHSNQAYQAEASDKTYELLAYQISKDASEHLTDEGLSVTDIREFLRLDEWLADFELDDFAFEPFGYSLNALRGSDYLTIHITPQAHSSYVSFESNLNLIELTPTLLDILKPASFDLVTFNAEDFMSQAQAHLPDFYISKDLVESVLDNGYCVNFATYLRPQIEFGQPRRLDLAGDNYEL